MQRVENFEDYRKTLQSAEVNLDDINYNHVESAAKVLTEQLGEELLFKVISQSIDDLTWAKHKKGQRSKVSRADMMAIKAEHGLQGEKVPLTKAAPVCEIVLTAMRDRALKLLGGDNQNKFGNKALDYQRHCNSFFDSQIQIASQQRSRRTSLVSN